MKKNRLRELLNEGKPTMDTDLRIIFDWCKQNGEEIQKLLAEA